jgi:hypothetical protein
LASLNVADFLIVSSNLKNRSAARLPQLLYVTDFAIQDYPCYARVDGCFGNLRETGAADGLENNAVRLQLRFALDEFQDLLALQDAVIIRVDDLYFNGKTAGRLFG